MQKTETCFHVCIQNLRTLSWSSAEKDFLGDIYSERSLNRASTQITMARDFHMLKNCGLENETLKAIFMHENALTYG